MDPGFWWAAGVLGGAGIVLMIGGLVADVTRPRARRAEEEEEKPNLLKLLFEAAAKSLRIALDGRRRPAVRFMGLGGFFIQMAIVVLIAGAIFSGGGDAKTATTTT